MHKAGKVAYAHFGEFDEVRQAMTERRDKRDPVRPTPEAAPRSEIVEAALKRNYPQVQYAFVEFISEHLADVSRAFGGDLQLPVLLAVLGQATIEGYTIAARAGIRVQDVDPRSIGLTAFRLADATGIPRETVRRKLHQMQRMGWLERRENYWVLTIDGDRTKVHADLADLNDRAIGRLARLFVRIAPWSGSD